MGNRLNVDAAGILVAIDVVVLGAIGVEVFVTFLLLLLFWSLVLLVQRSLLGCCCCGGV